MLRNSAGESQDAERNGMGGVGVQPDQSVTLYRLDEDYFDTL
jgi:hypothetical protein